MALRDREWPVFTQWFCCTGCGRLWTYQGSDLVVLDRKYALGRAIPSLEVPERICSVCAGEQPLPVIEL